MKQKPKRNIDLYLQQLLAPGKNGLFVDLLVALAAIMLANKVTRAERLVFLGCLLHATRATDTSQQ
jgi:hypothetical protein